MADPFLGRPFEMPMIKPFIPKKIQPWIYLIFACTFQLVDTLYLGVINQVAGDTGLMRDDVMFAFMCGVVGVAMPFPILFRLKFRFTNRQLLLFSVSGMIVCILLTLTTTSLPVLCVLSFLCCYFKLMATFECFSNIQLWMTPKRDFAIFFPLLYMVILGDMSMSGWLSLQFAYYCGDWRIMQWFIIGMLCLVLLYVYTCTRPFRFMKPIPFVSIDWLGGLMWSLSILQVIWLFNYGEYYNWFDSHLWCGVLVMLLVTIILTIYRMYHIRHPYIEPSAFKYKTLIPILFMFAVAELMNATPKALENVFTGGILHYGIMTSARFNIIAIIGNITGCMFCLWWYKMTKMKYTTLLTIGFSFLLVYQIWMYFYITPTIDIESFYFPTFIRNFGYTIFFVTLTMYLVDLMPFQHFFMGLTIAGFIRNGLVDSVCTGVYSYLLRYHITDNLVSGLPYSINDSIMMGVKQLFGVTCIGGCLFLIILLLWRFKPVRSSLKHLPYWNKIGKDMKKELASS